MKLVRTFVQPRNTRVCWFINLRVCELVQEFVIPCQTKSVWDIQMGSVRPCVRASVCPSGLVSGA